jgi:predicted peptidase
MKNVLASLTVLALAAFVAHGAQTANSSKDAGNAVQTPKTYNFSKTETATVNYLLHLPKGYKEGGKKWPLILFLHGAGERGTNIWRVAIHGPPSMVASNSNELPFIIVSPQCPEGRTWSKDILLGLLDDVMKNHAVDPERVYLTGLSMGGYGTWDLGLSHPDRFAAIAPICGGGQTISVLLSSREKAAAFKSLGIWAFHGAKDPVVPLQESERMVDACRRAGVQEVKFTVYPEANHNSWTETYNNPELYKWFLEHCRPGAKPGAK